MAVQMPIVTAPSTTIARSSTGSPSAAPRLRSNVHAVHAIDSTIISVVPQAQSVR